MKIIVFADSHTDLDTMSVVVKAEKPGMIIHLGDHLTDGLGLKALFGSIPIELIKGNTDMGVGYPEERVFAVNKMVFFIAHGNRYRVEDGIEDICERGKNCKADIILYGHTHKPMLCVRKGIKIMNPGRIGRKSSKQIQATYGLIELKEGSKHCEIRRFDDIAGTEDNKAHPTQL